MFGGTAPCQEVVLQGADIDLNALPIQTCWPGEPAPLITWPLVVTKGPSDKREDNFNLGIYRMALMVDDIQASYQTLLANGVSCPTPPVKLDMGPGVPVDGVWALFFPDPDGTCIELIERPTPTTTQ